MIKEYQETNGEARNFCHKIREDRWFRKNPQIPPIGHSGEPRIGSGADARISISVGLYLSGTSDSTVVTTFLGDHQDYAQPPPFERRFLRGAEKSIGHFAPRSLPPGYYFLSMALRQRARIERISKGSSINGNVGTPCGSRKALPASMCFLSPVKVA